MNAHLSFERSHIENGVDEVVFKWKRLRSFSSFFVKPLVAVRGAYNRFHVVVVVRAVRKGQRGST
jgi:hypothetical protein